MLFPGSLQIAELPQCEQDYCMREICNLVNKEIFEKNGCLLSMNWKIDKSLLSVCLDLNFNIQKGCLSN